VHPGESPASYAMTSIIKFLTNKDDIRASILRRFFVFKIIPIINVDGVYRGYYRFDTNSYNLNRHYSNPNIKYQPEIYAIKRLFLYYTQERRIRYYLDLHSHVQSKGVFLFGNSLDYLFQVENCLFPKVMEANIETLQLESCNFNEKSMKSREKGDMFSKEGTGRVDLYKCSGLIHCYTVEISYFRGITFNEQYEPYNLKDQESETNKDFLNFYNDLNNILDSHKVERENFTEVTNKPFPKNYGEDNKVYIPEVYDRHGIGLLVSILDYEELNPHSRIFNGPFKTVCEMRKYIANKLIQDESRFNNNVLLKDLAKEINYQKKFTPLYEKFMINKAVRYNSKISLQDRRNNPPKKHISYHLSGNIMDLRNYNIDPPSTLQNHLSSFLDKKPNSDDKLDKLDMFNGILNKRNENKYQTMKSNNSNNFNMNNMNNMNKIINSSGVTNTYDGEYKEKLNSNRTNNLSNNQNTNLLKDEFIFPKIEMLSKIGNQNQINGVKLNVRGKSGHGIKINSHYSFNNKIGISSCGINNNSNISNSNGPSSLVLNQIIKEVKELNKKNTLLSAKNNDKTAYSDSKNNVLKGNFSKYQNKFESSKEITKKYTLDDQTNRNRNNRFFSSKPIDKSDVYNLQIKKTVNKSKSVSRK